MTMESQGIGHSDTFTALPNQTSRLQELILLSRCSHRHSKSLMHADLQWSENLKFPHLVPVKVDIADMVLL